MRFQVLVLSTLFLISCASPKKAETPVAAAKTISSQHLLAGTVWFQSASETRALFYQGYNMAKMSLDLELKKKSDKKRAVVVDIDETVIDNSPYQAKLILENLGYPDHWSEWIDSEKGIALPGSLEFLTYADKKGVEVFYISNRKPNQLKQTINNLKKLGFPLRGESNVLLQDAESNKTIRREKVSATHNIVLLVGDNLNDFTGLYEKKSVAERKDITDKLKNEFGTKYIMLPNPMYGDWEGAILDYYKTKLNEEEKDAKRKSYLRSF
ncbi:MAG: 5'-nucleotidase, lipoprotein e(P4) family [Bacteriovoracaceae bacterium]